MTNPFISYLSSNVSVTKTNLQYDATVLDFTKTGYTIGIRSTYTLKHVSGHKYCLHAEIKSSIPGNFACEISNLSSGVVAVTSSWTRCVFFRTAGSSVDKNVIIKPQGIYYTQENNTYSVKNITVFDLTLIYGEGNEPSTPEQFEADYLRWFGKPLTYEPYDAGSLRSVQMQGLKTTGFNQWDEEWEVGGYDTSTGGKKNNTAVIRNKNKVRVLPNTTYYFKLPNGIRVFEYDASENYLGINTAVAVGTQLTTSTSTAFITFQVASSTTYNNDICINISDTNKNGTYEPYEEHNVSVPVTTLTGKVNGQGESVVIFPDGMKGVGDIKDEIKVENGVTKAIKRIGRVDLGSLTWVYKTTGTGTSSGQYPYFYSNAIDSLRYNSGTPILCYKYTVASNGAVFSGGQDKSIAQLSYARNNGLVARDTSYTDAATFKTAMSGVYLDYELAEPIEYVVDDFSLPASCGADRYGTEEVLPVSGEESIAPTFDVAYK